MIVTPAGHWSGIRERKLRLEKRELEILGEFRKKLKIKLIKPQIVAGKVLPRVAPIKVSHAREAS